MPECFLKDRKASLLCWVGWTVWKLRFAKAVWRLKRNRSLLDVLGPQTLQWNVISLGLKSNPPCQLPALSPLWTSGMGGPWPWKKTELLSLMLMSRSLTTVSWNRQAWEQSPSAGTPAPSSQISLRKLFYPLLSNSSNFRAWHALLILLPFLNPYFKLVCRWHVAIRWPISTQGSTRILQLDFIL